MDNFLTGFLYTGGFLLIVVVCIIVMYAAIYIVSHLVWRMYASNSLLAFCILLVLGITVLSCAGGGAYYVYQNINIGWSV